MNKAKQFLGCGFGTLISAVGTYNQTNEFLETASLIITIIGSLITLLVAIVPIIKRFCNKVKTALQDNKLTDEEIAEIAQAAQDGLEEISSQVSNLDKREDIKKERKDKNNG